MTPAPSTAVPPRRRASPPRTWAALCASALLATGCGRFGADAAEAVTIEPDDWRLTRSENVDFGDFGDDPGYAPSAPGDDEAIRVTLEKGSNYGTGSYHLLPEGTEEAWMSYCVRFARNWTTATGGKLPGFAGDSSPDNGGQGGAPATGDNAWSARGMYGEFDAEAAAVPLGQYVYHSAYAERSDYGDADWWAPGPDRLFDEAVRARHDRWYAVRQHLRVNAPGEENGLIEAWVDGERVYERDGLHFTDNEAFRSIHRIWLDVYHGGAEKSPHDQHVYFDQFNVSTGAEDATSVDCRN